MSCLNLKRFLPPKRVWKVFTNKLPLKLQRFSRSKAIKKPRNRSCKKLGWPSLSIQPKKFEFKFQPSAHALIHHQSSHCYFQKRAPPVFVEHLFIEPPAISVVKAHVLPSSAAGGGGGGANEEKSCLKRSTEIKNTCPDDDRDEITTADDVWESMVLASPQMQSINERAEEFIARFRAEMHHQEMLARRL